MRGETKPAPSPEGQQRVVILHNQPRFVEMMRKFTEEFSTVPPSCVYTFDLNQLPESSNRWLPSFDADIPLNEDEPLLVLQVARADRIFIGIDPASHLPPAWKVVLWALMKNRPHTKGSIVHLEDGRADAEVSRFLEDLATLADLDLVRWKPGVPCTSKLPAI